MKKNYVHLLLLIITGMIVVPVLSHVSNTDSIRSSAVTVITTKSSSTYISNYYSSISPSASGNTLKSSLETLLKNERNNSFSYSSMHSTAFPYTDVDPDRPTGGYIVSFYSGTPVYGYTGMNKEHTWPNSHGGGMIENDPHMVRPTLTSENSARGNMYYAEPPNIGWDPASFDNEKYRGIAARIIFYGATIGASSGLIIEDVGRGQDSGTGNRMGKLGDLLKWNLEYPVDQTEIIRNETLDISLNYNRNPFIDDPAYACKIWGNTNSNTQAICATSQPVAPTSITVSPSSSSVNMGDTLQLTATANSGASNNVTWSTSASSIATVSSSGVVTPVAVGSATITATSTLNTNIKGTASITVTNNPIAVSSISLSPTTLNLSISQTSTISPTFTPSNATNKNITWSSNQPTIASVNSSGVVTGVSVGQATITATTQDGGKTATTTVNVSEAPTGLVPVTDYAQITDGQYFITASYSSVNYYLPTASGAISNGSSSLVSFTDINSVPASALWTFTTAGTNKWTISYTYSSSNYVLNSTTSNDGIGASSSSSDTWTASTGSSSIYLYSTAGIRHLTTYLADNEWRGYTTANTNGSSNIILYKYGAPTSVAVTGISLDKTSETLFVGATSQLTATIAPANATNKNYTYESDNTGVVTVDQTGLVTAIGAGTASVSVTSEDGSFVDSVVYTVEAIEFESLTIKTPATKTTFTLGETFSYAGLVLEATYSNHVDTVSSGYSVSSVDTTLLGNHTVTVTYDGRTVDYEIKVTNQNASVGSIAPTATDLFISEYVEGSSNNKALEIYNGTGQTVSLSSYALLQYKDGATEATYTYPLTGSLPNGQTLIIANDGYAAITPASDWILLAYPSIATWTGNDALELRKSNVVIDKIGVVGQNTTWTDGGSKSTADKTLRRASSVTSPNTTFTWSEWVAYATNTSDGLGNHTLGEGSISGDVTIAEQAIAYAQYFINITDAYCEDLEGDSVPWNTLMDEYGYMANDSKDYFVENADNSDISSAKARYHYLINKYASLRADNFIADSDGVLLYSYASPAGANNSDGDNSLGSILLITIFSITALGGYYFFVKKKRQ